MPAERLISTNHAKRILLKSRRIRDNGFQESHRRRIPIKGLGIDGCGIHGMAVEYLVGPEAMRLSRKCRKDRNRDYHSGINTTGMSRRVKREYGLLRSWKKYRTRPVMVIMLEKSSRCRGT